MHCMALIMLTSAVRQLMLVYIFVAADSAAVRASGTGPTGLGAKASETGPPRKPGQQVVKVVPHHIISEITTQLPETLPVPINFREFHRAATTTVCDQDTTRLSC